MKSSTDGDGDEISLIFVLPVTDIELSRAVPRVNKNLKKKKEEALVVVQQLFNAFLLIRVCAFIFCLFFSSFSDSFIFDTFRQRPSFYHPEYSARVLNVDRVIDVELTHLESIV